ncbi:hypothetical protein Syun_015234 [Stephania yunnanensis]|uniref:F-box domain-containing protein n=1 Tax=Stephania yunnanensis TaxID=152371 RepID=A0AAP0JLA4_9MAGN
MKKTKTINRSSSSSVESEIGEDIIFQEILPRLPINSIFRFILVSKKWLNLITRDPLFHALHSQKCPNITTSGFFCPQSKLFFSSDDHYYQFKWSKLEFTSSPLVNFSASTNGLLYGMHNHCRDIFIFNPITKHALSIPNSKSLGMLGLATNPDFGFTMVSVSVSPYRHGLLKFKLYSPKTAEWRVSKNDSMIPAYYYLFLRKSQVVFPGGNKVYWSLVKGILWFDVEKEVAGLIECPDLDNLLVTHPLQHRSFTSIGVCDGELSYIKLTKKGEVKVWLLREISNEFKWMRKLDKVKLQRIFEKNWNVITKIFEKLVLKNPKEASEHFIQAGYAFPLPYSGGEDLWFTITLNSDPKVFLFNLRTEELKLIRDDVLITYPIFPFIPTLLPCPV